MAWVQKSLNFVILLLSAAVPSIRINTSIRKEVNVGDVSDKCISVRTMQIASGFILQMT